MFGGKINDDASINEIQALSFKEVIKEQNQEEWRILAVRQEKFTPRYRCVTYPLNETEIVIMGSWDPQDDRVFILNTETEQLEFVGEGGAFKFYTHCNGNVKVKANKVLSVV